MKKILVLILIVFGSYSVQAQMYFTKTGHINFFSSTPVEDINADNHKVTSIINASTGQMEFAVLMKAFEFEKALMQEHFNENYVESNKFPQATFDGNIINFDVVNLKKDGTYDVQIKGDLTIHGVTKQVEAPGKITVKDGKIVSGISTFLLNPEDYDISIPKMVKPKISDKIKITVDMKYAAMKR